MTAGQKKSDERRPDEDVAARRILVVDDHPIVRNGLSQLINRERDLAVCGEAGSGNEAVEAVDKLKPDLLLLDIAISGANGIEITKMLRDTHPELPVLILSMHDENLYAERALRAGAKGYVMKQEAPGTVLKAMRQVLSGKLYVSENVTSRLIKDLLSGQVADKGRPSVENLSDRELEIFELIGNGESTREIAEQLSLSVKTIETHRAHIRQKLKLQNAVELAHHAIRWVENEGKEPWN